MGGLGGTQEIGDRTMGVHNTAGKGRRRRCRNAVLRESG